MNLDYTSAITDLFKSKVKLDPNAITLENKFKVNKSSISIIYYIFHPQHVTQETCMLYPIRCLASDQFETIINNSFSLRNFNDIKCYTSRTKAFLVIQYNLTDKCANNLVKYKQDQSKFPHYSQLMKAGIQSYIGLTDRDQQISIPHELRTYKPYTYIMAKKPRPDNIDNLSESLSEITEVNTINDLENRIKKLKIDDLREKLQNSKLKAVLVYQ